MRTISAFRALVFAAASGIGAAALTAQQAPDSASRTADTSRAAAAGGASRVMLDSAALAGAPMRTFSDMLAARAPGLSVLRSSGTVGTGSRVRLRGAGGTLATDEPLLIVDGVRADGEQASLGLGVGGQQPSRLDDIVPEDVERVEILMGPAAAWQYGTGAENGVILVTTKRGRPGPARWRVLTAQGVATDRTEYPANYGTPGTSTYDGRATPCPLDWATFGGCVPTGPVQTWNPLERASPFDAGREQQAAASVSGGARALGYYASAGWHDQRGVLDGNDQRRASARGNVEFRPHGTLRMALAAGYVDGRTRLPQGDAGGILPSGLLGASADDPEYRGYAQNMQADIEPVPQTLGRATTSLVTDWRPRPGIRVRGTLGQDNVNRVERRTFASGSGDFADIVQAHADAHDRRRTVALDATASYPLAGRLTGSTSVGFERSRVWIAEHWTARITRVSDGLTWASLRTSFTPDANSTGFLVRQRVAWSDRLEASVGLRSDANRVGGLQFWRARYPSADAAWTVYESGPGARGRWLDALSVRAAYGEAGDLRPHLSPESNEVLYYGTSSSDGPKQLVQRSREREVGLDARLLDGRVRLELTQFRKTTGDVRMLVPGQVGDIMLMLPDAWRNSGVEAQLSARVVDRAGLRWDAVANVATDRSTAVGTWHRTVNPLSDPLGGYWTVRYQYADENGDGLLESAEIRPAPVPPGGRLVTYAGPSLPTREVSLGNTVRLGDRVSLGALVDHRGGHLRFNRTEDRRCAAIVCRARHDSTTSLADQARAIVAGGYLGGLGAATEGFLEDGSFTRLRELSAAVDLPAAWTRRLGAHGATFTLAARNLATWTSYDGLDPEVSATGQTGSTIVESFTQPLLRSVTARLDVTW